MAIRYRREWLIIGLTCLGPFIAQLDASIVQLALPALGVAFRAPLDAVSWVALGYLLALAAFLPVFGRLCETFGRRRPYVGGFLLFTLASALCGFAPDLAWLVAARVLQGIGGAMLAANSIVILSEAAGEGGRARALGLFAAAQAVGLSVGPVVGGVLLASAGWRFVFWVTVPVGIAGSLAATALLPPDVAPERKDAFDWLGALLLIPALVALVLTLNQAASWSLEPLMASAAATVLLLALLAAHERRRASPLIDLRLFSSPTFAGGIVAVMLSAALLYGMFLIMSFGLVRGYHRPVEAAGLRLAAIPVAIGLVSPFSGALAARFGPRAAAVGGMALCVAALLLLGMIATEPRADVVLGAIGLLVFGTGLGLFIAPNNHRTLGAAPRELSGEAGALVNLLRVLGSSLGVASATSLLSWRVRAVSGAGGWAVFQGRPLLAAVESGFVLLMGFAVLAAVLSARRGRAP